MFKFIHVTDTHFGLATFGVENVLSGLNTRAEDGFSAFDQLIDYAITNKIKLIVHSGDVFNTKTISQTVVNAFYERAKRISDAGIDFYILQGNHDASRILVNRNGLDLANILELPHVYVTRGNGPLIDLGYIQLCSVSYWATSEEIEAQIALYAQEIDWSRPAVLVVHLQIEYANFPGSFKEDLQFTPLALLTSHPWTYVAAGHIHKPQLIADEPPVYYGGSLVRCSFAEEKDKKGFNVISVDGVKATEIKKQPVNCLKMLTLKGNMTYFREGLTDVNPDNFENVIIRCIIDETEEVIDEKFLRTTFAKAFKAIIQKEKKPNEVARMDRGGNLTNMQDALKLYFKDEPDIQDLFALIEELKNSEEKVER
jgi:DNA repair exonuclease SbcCD nuclease subunit